MPDPLLFVNNSVCYLPVNDVRKNTHLCQPLNTIVPHVALSFLSVTLLGAAAGWLEGWVIAFFSTMSPKEQFLER